MPVAGKTSAQNTHGRRPPDPFCSVRGIRAYRYERCVVGGGGADSQPVQHVLVGDPCAGLGMQGLQTALQGAGQMGALGQQEFGQRQAALGMQQQPFDLHQKH